MASTARAFLARFDVPGLGFAVAHEGRVVCEEAIGLADIVARTPLSTANSFRIASISKPITAVAVLKLIQDGKLELASRVLGPGGVLGDNYGRVDPASWLAALTIEHLLMHTGGGWPNDASDPMMRHTSLDHADLIARTLKEQPLTARPGSAFAYSNFGYCVLGRVIERATGRPYADFAKEAVLAPAGIADMAVARNGRDGRQADEVRYLGQRGEDPYRGNVARMDSHGGWIARPAALTMFASNVDGFGRPSILHSETIRLMVTPSSANPGYAKGWQVNAHGNWWHTGNLPGTSGILVRTQSGFCWAALVNSRQKDRVFKKELERTGWAMVRSVAHWRA